MTLVVALLAMAAAACLAPWLARRLDRDAGYPLAAVFLAVGVMLTASAPAVLAGDEVRFVAQWVPSLDVAFRLRMDGLSLLFVVLVLGVGALIMSYCARYLSHSHEHGRLYTLLTMFATAMLGLVLADDLVVLFVFWELTTICSFLLIGGPGLKAARPATRALVTTGGGGLALLGAVVLLGYITGTTDLTGVLQQSDAIRAHPLGTAVAVLVILAAFTKSAQFPFHYWLPDAMVALTPVSAYLHAATLVKGGIYLLLRFSPPFAGEPGWTVTLVTVGLVTSVFGALLALKQHDLKGLLAYSTVSQLGWIVALIGVGTPTALASAALHTFAHALFKATLFMLVGVIDREAGSRDIRRLSGLWRVMPVTATLTGMAALSMAGLPPFLGFVSKEESYYSFLELPQPWSWVVAGVAVGSAALTFAYGFRILYGAFGGPTLQKRLYEPSFMFLLPAAVPAVLGLLLGVFTSSLNPLVNRTVQDTSLTEGTAELALWHGITSPALWLSVVTVALGTVLFARRDPVDARLQRFDPRPHGVDVFDRLYDGAIALGDRVGRPTRTGLLAPHLLPVLALVLLVGAAGALGLDALADTPVPTTRPGDWVLVGLLAVTVPALCLARSRLAAVGLLGVVGLVVGAWFAVLGAPDLALTQILVEILTVVVMVLLLRRLPERFSPTSRLRAGGAAVVAVLAALVAGAGTLALTGRRELSEAGSWLLANGPEESGGTNVVNTVLVDFRGLDTMGEAAVLAMAALGLLTLLRAQRPQEADEEPSVRPLATGAGSGDRVVVHVAARLLGPTFLVVSLWLLWRGHYEPGGGFISALVAGAGVAVMMLPDRTVGQRVVGTAARLRRRLGAALLVGSGLVVSVAAGLIGLLVGSFLRPIKTEVVIGPFSQSLTTSFIFDIGVYLCVVGIVVAAVDRLADGRSLAQAAAEARDGRPADRVDARTVPAGSAGSTAPADREEVRR